jgi:uncharacterized protein YfaT (DUF1175 family)
MGKVKSIEHQVEALSPDELASFREWFVVFDAEAWDRQLEADVAAGKLDTLAENALKAHASGTTTKL